MFYNDLQCEIGNFILCGVFTRIQIISLEPWAAHIYYLSFEVHFFVSRRVIIVEKICLYPWLLFKCSFENKESLSELHMYILQGYKWDTGNTCVGKIAMEYAAEDGSWWKTICALCCCIMIKLCPTNNFTSYFTESLYHLWQNFMKLTDYQCTETIANIVDRSLASHF